MGIDSGTEQDLAFTYTHGSTLYSNIAGVFPEVRDYENHYVRMRLPFNHIHTNHVNSVYAGSLFVLAEVAGGSMFEVTLGTDKYMPVIYSASIRYKAPVMTEAIIDAMVTDEDVQALKASVAERGRGKVPFQLVITDTDGKPCVEADMVFYALPYETS